MPTGIICNSASAPFSSWVGITCSAQSGSVVALNLNTYSLKGSLSSTLAVLTQLTRLDLYGNSLVGPIPTQFGNLIKLQFFRLGFNLLTGALPTQFGLLTALNYFSFSSCSFSGSIPSQLGLLTGLQSMYLSSNKLSGQIPTQLGLLVNLVFLQLQFNSLAGTMPTELGLLTNLTGGLALHGNSIGGTVPSQLGLLTSINLLNLNANSLSGTLPTQLCQLTALFNTGSLDISGQKPAGRVLYYPYCLLYLAPFSITQTVPTPGLIFKYDAQDIMIFSPSDSETPNDIPTKAQEGKALISQVLLIIDYRGARSSIDPRSPDPGPHIEPSALA